MAVGAAGGRAARTAAAVAARLDPVAGARARGCARRGCDRRRARRPLLLGAPGVHNRAGAGLHGARRGDRPAGGVRLRAHPLPGASGRARAGDGTVRAADAGRRARLPAARGPRRGGHDLGDPRRAPLLQRGDRDPPGRRGLGQPRPARGGGGAAARRRSLGDAARGHAAGARARDRLGGRARLRLLVHLVRGRARARRAGPRHARGSDLPARDPPRRASRRGRALDRADHRHRGGAWRLLAAAAPRRAAARAPHGARPAAARDLPGGARAGARRRRRARAAAAGPAGRAGARRADARGVRRRHRGELPPTVRGHRAAVVRRAGQRDPLERDLRPRIGAARVRARHARGDGAGAVAAVASARPPTRC